MVQGLVPAPELTEHFARSARGITCLSNIIARQSSHRERHVGGLVSMHSLQDRGEGGLSMGGHVVLVVFTMVLHSYMHTVP